MKSRLSVKKGVVMAALAAGLVFSVAAKSEAAFIAYICNDAACIGGDDFIVSDNTGIDTNAAAGLIDIQVNNYNGFSVTTNNSQSKPALANGMDLNYRVTTTGTAGGTIWLYAGDTDFVGPATLTGFLGGTSDNGSVTASLCGGDANGAFNNSPCVSGTDNTTPSIVINIGPLNATANPYSILIGAQITLAGPGTTATGDLRVNSSAKIPEPASMLLFGLGLAGLGFWGRKRLGQ